VTCAGQEGWVSGQYFNVTTTPPPGGSVGTVVNTGGDNLRCRTAPVSGAIIMLLAPNTQVPVRGPISNGWWPVTCAGQNGWVSGQYFSVSGGGNPTPTPTEEPDPDPDPQFGTVSNTDGDNLRCRTAPVSGAIIVLLAPNTEVELRGPVSNGWYPVRCAGQNGWVSALYLTVDGGEPGPGPSVAYIDTAGMLGANCRTGPTTDAGIITTLPWGSAVTVRGDAANGWTPVRCANQNGYIFSTLLSDNPPSASVFGPIDRVTRAPEVARTYRRTRRAGWRARHRVVAQPTPIPRTRRSRGRAAAG
jgi:D-alanyl-D-alanine carboxypeptidase